MVVLEREGCSSVVKMDLNSLLSRRLCSVAFWVKDLAFMVLGGTMMRDGVEGILLSFSESLAVEKTG